MTRLKSLETWQLGFFLLMLVSVSLSIAVSQICLGLVLAILLYRGLVERQWPARNGVEKAALALALWALGMIPLAADVPQAALYYRRFFLFAALWAGSSLGTSSARRQVMLACILVGALAAVAIGEVKLARTASVLFAGRLRTESNSMTSGAMLMLPALTAIGWLALRGGSRRWRLGVILGALPIAFALLQTLTRSALLGTVAGIGAMVLLVRPRMFAVFLVLLAMLLGVVYGGGEAVVPAGIWRRINPKTLVTASTTTARLDMWRGGWEMVKAHPLTGVGDCDMQSLSPQYYGDDETTYFGHLHSNPVMLAAIWGVPGFLLGQVFIFVPLVLLVRKWRRWRAENNGRGDPPDGAGWVVGAVGAWTGFYVAGFTEWYFGDAEPMMLYLAILGIALAAANESGVGRTSSIGKGT